MFLSVICPDLSPQNQRVGDLAPVRTGRTHAGVLAVHLGTRVRTFDLDDLLVHPIPVVGVHIRQPLGVSRAVLTHLCPRQKSTPDWLQSVFLRILYIRLDLRTASTRLSPVPDLREASLSVL